MEKQVFLFVQVADSGSLVPKEGAAGQYVLTLNGVAPQTVYFSDRPARVAGHVTTDSFLKGLGFSDKNPPNAAVEVAQAAEDEDTIVVELRHPVYDAAKATLQYDVTIMADAKGGLAYYDKKRDNKLPRAFSNVSLFIDDCPPAQVTCTKNSNLQPCGTFMSTPSQVCFKVVASPIGPVGGCVLCDLNICTEKYPQCCPTMTACQNMSQIQTPQPLPPPGRPPFGSPPGPLPGPPPPNQTSPITGSFHGRVTAISGGSWTIKGDTKSMTVVVNSSSRVFPNIKVGDKVTIMLGAGNVALMIAPE